jgi:hypothetical protein
MCVVLPLADSLHTPVRKIENSINGIQKRKKKNIPRPSVFFEIMSAILNNYKYTSE